VTADALIVVSHLTKIFHPLQLRWRSLRPIRRQPPVTALQEVSLTVRQGEILGLLGTNGAGKTTLLKILATLILPTSGEVRVAGYDVQREADHIKALIGFVLGEERSFYWRLTGRQNLAFFATFCGLTSPATRRRLEQLREQLNLDGLERRFGEYSTGMRHRLAIARALLHEPRVLLLDEPTRSLDPLAALQLRHLIKHTLVRQGGRTAIIATHNVHEAEELCDRIAILHQGRLVAWGTLDELRRLSGNHAATLVAVFERLATTQLVS